MSTKRAYCLCAHSDLAHSGNGWCRVLLCGCRAFALKARLVKATETAPVVLHAPTPANALDTAAEAAFHAINAKLGFRARRTAAGVEVEAFVGGQIVNCRRVDVEKITATGDTLTAALAALLGRAEKQ